MQVFLHTQAFHREWNCLSRGAWLPMSACWSCFYTFAFGWACCLCLRMRLAAWSLLDSDSLAWTMGGLPSRVEGQWIKRRLAPAWNYSGKLPGTAKGICKCRRFSALIETEQGNRKQARSFIWRLLHICWRRQPDGNRRELIYELCLDSNTRLVLFRLSWPSFALNLPIRR